MKVNKQMNYNEFIKAVDGKLDTMSNSEKGKWMHNLARSIKEHERKTFLDSLNGENNYVKTILHDIKGIKDWCEKIQDGDVNFECSYREEYGDNYWEDYSYEYFDTHEIGIKLTKAFQTAEDLLYQKEYEQASELYNLLIGLRFQAYDNDAEETNELEIEELVDEELVSLDLKQIVINLIYAKYQASEGKERVSSLFSYLKWSISKDIKLEECFIIGPEEIVGIDVFMEEWITFLRCEDGDLAGKLISEACIFQGGIEKLCNMAREMVYKHPVLYLRACEYLINEKREAECEKIGLEAIGLIGEELIIRAKVADLTVKAAGRLGHKDVIWECYKVAFYAESTLNHYLRLFEIENYMDITNIDTIKLEALPEKVFVQSTNINNQMRINRVSQNHMKLLCFFNGEFDYIYEECKKDKTYLGWSNNIKGVFVPLFILFLDRNKCFTKTGEKLIDGIKYRLNYSEDDEKSFLERFLIWKDKIKITGEQYEEYITWLYSEVDKRTDAVVGGGYRNSYYKAALLISALGETMESHDKQGAKESIIEHYKKIHSRKRAFKGEFESIY